MPLTLGTNITSLSVAKNLSDVTDLLSKTYERLSSGQKINGAGDDPVGGVISQYMNTILKNSDIAKNNIQIANNFLTYAEGSITSIEDQYQRIYDISLNMANGTNDTDSKLAVIEEIIERLDEINRIARSANFNGINLLDGSVDSLAIQTGIDNTENSVLDIAPAFSDFQTNAFNTDLPDELNPENDLFDPSGDNFRNYIKTIQAAIDDISVRRGIIGSYGNRIDSAYDELLKRTESLENAKSQISDTDVAFDSSNFVRQQILQQINASLLSSANSSTEMALQLLAG